ncbi:MAG: hypothetical protein ACREIT_11195 [Tepidisphaeraceae bacterium]
MTLMLFAPASEMFEGFVRRPVEDAPARRVVKARTVGLVGSAVRVVLPAPATPARDVAVAAYDAERWDGLS